MSVHQQDEQLSKADYNIIKLTNTNIFTRAMDSPPKQPLINARRLEHEEKLQGFTVLLVFLLVVIVTIYLISMLLIFFRKLKNIFKSRHSTRAYYLIVFIYIVSKLILCTILIIEIISKMPDDWETLKGQDIQIVLKNSIQVADLTILQLFYVALYSYLKLCFIAMDKNQIKVTISLSQKIKRTLLFGVKIMVGIAALAFMIPLIIFDFKLINYQLLNGISTGFNCFAILLFLSSFFFLNFKMTGIMVEPKLNSVIKKIYKVLAIIFLSRILMVAVQITIAFKINDGSFESFMQFFEQLNGQIITFGIGFVGVIMTILLTEGLPLMYSLRSSVFQAFSLSMMFRERKFNNHQSIITYNSSVMKQELLRDTIFQYDSEPEDQVPQLLSLGSFNNLCDLKDSEDSIWNLKRGQIGTQDFILKIAKHQISSYIIQDVQTQIAKWNQLQLTHLNSVRYFKENQFICIVEKFLPYNLDAMIGKTQNDKEVLLIALDLAKAIQQMHLNQIAHGSLKPACVLFDSRKKLFFTGLGLQSFKKYLSLITGYTNKSMYSSVQILADRNNVTIKPTKQSDVYSFGMIFYEMITKNHIYREQTLKQCKDKFYQEKARPKILQSLKTRVKALIRDCWSDDAPKRPTISQVILNLKKIIDEN